MRLHSLPVFVTLASAVAACATLHDSRQMNLPDPLVMASGKAVETREAWDARRAEMIAALLDTEYGHAPPVPEVTVTERKSEDIQFASGLWATKVSVQLAFGGITMQAGYWKPRGAAGPLPAILAIEPVWWPNPFEVNGVAERVVSRGFILAGFWKNDLASFEDPTIHPAQDAYPGYDWGVVAVGAWGYRVTMNWLETDPAVDAAHVAIWGHSRGGKACILAGALDTRFAAVVPHMSGMGGTALYRVRGKGAQELEQLLEQYWLHPRMFTFTDREDAIPFDQHWLHALVAPRPLYAHVGRDDAWGNPPGERAAFEAALPVYRMLGAADKLGLYVGDYDHHDPNGPEGGDSWETLLQFLEWHFAGKIPAKDFCFESGKR